MKKILVALLLMSTVLMAGENKKKAKVWEPYKFKGTEHFKYALVMKDADGNTKQGEYIIDLSKQGKKYKVKVNGSFDGNEGSVSTSVDDASSIPGVIFAQMIFNPWLAPLTTTLFANAFVAVFTGSALTNGLEEGSHWSYKSKDGDKVEFDVKGECKYAGRKGKLLTMKTNGKTVYETCIDPDVALPIYIKYMDKDDGSVSSMELIEYKE